MDQHVKTAVDRHVAAVTHQLPGLLVGYYIVGSAAAGQYVHGTSDLDFVGVISRSLTRTDTDALCRVHSGMPRRPVLEGVYVEADRLGDPPQDKDPVPHAYAGRFYAFEKCCLLVPMLWMDLRSRGVAVVGPPAGSLGIGVSPDRVREYAARNLATHWGSQVAAARESLHKVDPGRAVNPVMIAWVVLSVARTYYSWAERGLTSKEDAGCYAAMCFPRYRDLVEETIAWRHGRSISFTTSDALAAVGFAQAMIDHTKSCGG